MRVGEPFSVDVERRGEALVVRPSGELDLASAPVVDEAIDAAVDGAAHLVLDLSSLRFIDTSGMRLVLTRQQACERAGRRFTLVAGRAEVQRLFEIGGVLDRLPFAADLRQALREP